MLSDERIRLTGVNTKEHYPDDLRLVTAEVEVKGKMVVMTFITNNFEWSPYVVSELYQCRWGVKVLFKEIKQTQQLADFHGYNEKRRPVAGLDRAACLPPAAVRRLAQQPDRVYQLYFEGLA